ncbi:putative E3 ubiquitin ligase complex SCF subunit sconB [Intoshia linei]|uniref:Putative E3 ubiquitin ligase complex SCF subunit sconB n=1 Tax=Intoshia linei TaxID=1819745 RepID=A0A177BA95_9BILA|nr:putative E3 ubiquitin ligase complex SCF subunit sconB [Intoshia linei]
MPVGDMNDEKTYEETNVSKILKNDDIALNYKCFKKLTQEDKVTFVKIALIDMNRHQISSINHFLKPILKRDFISLFSAMGLYDVSAKIINHFDSNTIQSAEMVSRDWITILNTSLAWRKLLYYACQKNSTLFNLIKRIKSDNLINPKNAIPPLCDNKFFKTLYNRSRYLLAKLDENWKNGQYNLRKINCNSTASKGVYCFQYDNNKIICGLRDNTMKIWSRHTLNCTHVLRGHSGSILCLQYDENIVISGSSDSTMKIWDVNTGELLNTLSYHVEAVLHLKFLKDMLVSCSKDRSVAIWKICSPTDIKYVTALVGHRAAVNVVDFDMRYIVSASGDRSIKIWYTNSLEFVRTLNGHKRGIACLQFRNNLIITGSSDNTIRIWDINIGDCIRVLEGHNELVRCIRFNDSIIVSGAYDGKIKIWDLRAAVDLTSTETNFCIITLMEHTGRVFRLLFDDFHILSSSHDDTLLIWDFLPESDNEEDRRNSLMNNEIMQFRNFQEIDGYIEKSHQSINLEYDVAGAKGSAIHWLAFMGMNRQLERLHSLGIKLNCVSKAPNWQRPIHWACQSCQVSTVALLIKSGVSVNEMDSKSACLLTHSCISGSMPLVSFLVGKNANIDSTDSEGDTPLHWACNKGFLDIAKFLVQNSANPHKIDDFNQNTLHFATMSGNLDLVKFLIEKCNVDSSLVDKNNRTAFDLAARRKNYAIIDYLKSRNSCFNRYNPIKIVIGSESSSTYYRNGTIFVYIYLFTMSIYKIHNNYNVSFVSFVSPFLLITNILGVFSYVYLLKHNPGYVNVGFDYDNALCMIGTTESIVENLCHVCKLRIPDRAKHCFKCNKCILNFDHHCNYVDNCIGLKNRSIFFLFLNIILSNVIICFFMFISTASFEGVDLLYILMLSSFIMVFVPTFILYMTSSFTIFQVMFAMNMVNTEIP